MADTKHCRMAIGGEAMSQSNVTNDGYVVAADFMKFKTWKNSYWSFGFIFGRDCVVSSYEPYEQVSYWEPHFDVYLGKRTFRLWAKVTPSSWIGRRWGRTRWDESF